MDTADHRDGIEPKHRAIGFLMILIAVAFMLVAFYFFGNGKIGLGIIFSILVVVFSVSAEKDFHDLKEEHRKAEQREQMRRQTELLEQIAARQGSASSDHPSNISSTPPNLPLS